MHADDMESNHLGAPRSLSLQEEPHGAYDLALFSPVYRGHSAAEIAANPLPYLHDGEDGAVEAYQIELAASTSQIACDYPKTLRSKVRGRKLFRCGAALQAGNGRHA